MVKDYCQKFGLNFCLKVLGVAKSTFYTHKGKESSLTEKYQHLRARLTEIVEKNPSYGYRRIQLELKRGEKPIIINHKPLKKLLKLWGLSVLRRVKKRKKSGIEKILQVLGERANLVKRLKGKLGLFKLFFTDYTRLVYQNGQKVLWLCPFLEAKTKAVSGCGLSKSPDTQTALEGYGQTKRFVQKHKEEIKGAIIHQDQGSPFKSYEYVGELVKDQITLSYSRKGKPEDNPEMESFIGRFKDEWEKVIFEAQTEKEVKAIVKKAIKYYNRDRIHSNHNCPPFEFLRKLLEANCFNLA